MLCQGRHWIDGLTDCPALGVVFLIAAIVLAVVSPTYTAVAVAVEMTSACVDNANGEEKSMSYS